MNKEQLLSCPRCYFSRQWMKARLSGCSRPVKPFDHPDSRLEAKAFISLCLPTYYSLTEVIHVWMGGGCQERLPLESLTGSQACLIFHQSWLRAWIISDWAVLCRAYSSETPETIYIIIQHRARELLQVLTEQKIERKRIIQSYSLIQNAKVW